MLHPVRLNESKRIHKNGLMERYFKNLGQGTNSLKRWRKRGFISIKSYKKAKYDAQKLIVAKKQAFFDVKLSVSVGKPKEYPEISWYAEEDGSFKL